MCLLYRGSTVDPYLVCESLNADLYCTLLVTSIKRHFFARVLFMHIIQVKRWLHKFVFYRAIHYNA